MATLNITEAPSIKNKSHTVNSDSKDKWLTNKQINHFVRRRSKSKLNFLGFIVFQPGLRNNQYHVFLDPRYGIYTLCGKCKRCRPTNEHGNMSTGVWSRSQEERGCIK